MALDDDQTVFFQALDIADHGAPAEIEFIGNGLVGGKAHALAVGAAGQIGVDGDAQGADQATVAVDDFVFQPESAAMAAVYEGIGGHEGTPVHV